MQIYTFLQQNKIFLQKKSAGFKPADFDHFKGLFIAKTRLLKLLH
ncbi:hypothetical protein RG47T_0559 [Mucilaginibacter polytrichastri]|uniref:Uncharacterized protein n=1 Tax=Mucilaginibacter polytrichastri TaxID=1302689 RepID=A0A1Q5ZTM3_9SPHI|nr:hypothetical protein RG47T_0559 [Mucilaginibacter polytrichastri]